MTEEDDSERVVLLQRLQPDAFDDYVAAHDDVPDSVVAAMEEADIEEYELYVKGDVAVSVMTVPDLEEFEEIYEQYPENHEWEKRVSQFKRSGIDPDDMKMPEMERIWSLDEARD